MGTVDMAMVVIMRVVVMIVVAVGAMDMGLLVMLESLRNKIAGNYLAITHHVHVIADE